MLLALVIPVASPRGRIQRPIAQLYVLHHPFLKAKASKILFVYNCNTVRLSLKIPQKRTLILFFYLTGPWNSVSKHGTPEHQITTTLIGFFLCMVVLQSSLQPDKFHSDFSFVRLKKFENFDTQNDVHFCKIQSEFPTPLI